MLSAARWVAHVPFVDDASFGKRRSNVWANNSDFVGMAAGDHEEHAHLLAGYFMELGQEVRHQLGSSIHAGFVNLLVVCVSCFVSNEYDVAGQRQYNVELGREVSYPFKRLCSTRCCSQEAYLRSTLSTASHAESPQCLYLVTPSPAVGAHCAGCIDDWCSSGVCAHNWQGSVSCSSCSCCVI